MGIGRLLLCTNTPYGGITPDMGRQNSDTINVYITFE